MQKRYQGIAMTPLGKQIAAIIDQPNRQIELDAFSREGFPAVTALVSQLKPVLLPLRKKDLKRFNFAKQYVGAYVGEMMQRAGRTIVNSGKRVPGKLFSVGAVWSSS